MVDGLREHGAAVGVELLHGFHVGAQDAGADAEQQAALEQVVDQRRLRRHQERMVERQINHRRAEFYLRGEAGERRAEHQARRNVLGEIGEMLAAIAFAVAQSVGEDEGLAVFPQRLGIGTRQRVDRHDEEAELHRISPGRSRVNMRAYSPLIPMSIYLPCLFCYCITPQAGPRRQPDMLIQLQRFLKNESGAAAIEYGLLASGISVAIIPAVKDVGTKLVQVFTVLQNAV